MKIGIGEKNKKPLLLNNKQTHNPILLKYLT